MKFFPQKLSHIFQKNQIRHSGILIILAVSLSFLSCTYRAPFTFWDGLDSGSVLYTVSKNSGLGSLPLSSEGKLEYDLTGFQNLKNNYALQINYSLQNETPYNNAAQNEVLNGKAVLVIAGLSWELPLDFSFLGKKVFKNISYTVPLVPGTIEKITVNWIPQDPKSTGEKSFLKINSIKLTSPWYGVSFAGDNTAISLSPFVYYKDGALVIDPPQSAFFGGDLDIKFINAGKITIEGGAKGDPGYFKIEGDNKNAVFIPGQLISQGPIKINGPEIYSAALAPDLQAWPTSAEPVAAGQTAAGQITADPITADPGLIINWPQEKWRDKRYEVFRWDGFPSVLIFDMADYDIQDRFLKRLAFFAEKAGFTGRLPADSEIAGLHGWNAHDYRSETLAAFYNLAETTKFPLLPEERELETILFNNGIIVRSQSGIIAGSGAIISITRESEDYLRSLFINHEGFHGIYFTDADFREFCKQRWQKLAPVPRAFILSYFDYQAYDTKDNYLVINEFMAHIMQQPVSGAEKYFGETLAGRIDASSWRRTVLPPKDEATGTWPELGIAFRTEAEALSAYVNQRWGLAAGRVRTLTLTR